MVESWLRSLDNCAGCVQVFCDLGNTWYKTTRGKGYNDTPIHISNMDTIDSSTLTRYDTSQRNHHRYKSLLCSRKAIIDIFRARILLRRVHKQRGRLRH